MVGLGVLLLLLFLLHLQVFCSNDTERQGTGGKDVILGVKVHRIKLCNEDQSNS